MKDSEMVLALMVLVFVMMVAVFMRQGDLMSIMRKILARTEAMAGDDDRKMDAYIAKLLGENRRNEAIRIYRASHGASLADAIAAVDKMSPEKVGG